MSAASSAKGLKKKRNIQAPNAAAYAVAKPSGMRMRTAVLPLFLATISMLLVVK
jgi:hypothetical protein